MAHEWKIRSMDEADSSAAVEAAQRAKVTTAVWVGRAIREAVNREREPIAGEVIQAIEVRQMANGHDRDGLALALNVTYAPKWLRAGAARRLGAELGIEVPKSRPGPRRLVAAPEGREGEGG